MSARTQEVGVRLALGSTRRHLLAQVLSEPLLGAAAVLMGVAVAASLMPAARASRVDVMQALRSE